MAPSLWLLVALLATPAGEPEALTVDVAHTPFRLAGGARRFVTSSEGGALTVHLRGSLLNPPDKRAELLFDLRKTPLAGRAWGNRASVQGEVRVSPELVGHGLRNWYRAHRGRLFLEDARGKRQYFPNASIVDRPRATDGWIMLTGHPTIDVPMPLGFTDDGFDPSRVTGLGLSVDAFNREGEIVDGTIELRRLRVGFGPPVAARVLPPDPAVIAGEPARAARMQERLAARCGVGAHGMAVGVDLAWPSARAPNGEPLQLYGRILDGGRRWFDRYWDLGEAEVVASVRADFRGIRETFGAGAPVRLWLFGDLRSGMTFDATGVPGSVTARARANMKVLLQLAAEEKVVLVPVLIDFVMADGVSRSGPDGQWEVGERPDLITDANKRHKLVAALEDFVRAFAGDPAILVWDVMNEPDNAAAVVDPAHLADVQALLGELVDAVHRAGDLATVGHRNVPDPQRFFRGREAIDLGEVHYYPFIETRPNPTPFGVRLGPTFGPLPAGWGELQAMPGHIAAQMEDARKAGHRLFMFWSWRGHEETGDGFAVQPYAAEIRQALRRSRGK